MGNFNAGCDNLISKGLMEEEEETGRYNVNLFSGCSSGSEDKVVNKKGRKLISFYETLNLDVPNGRRESGVKTKMMFISKADSSVTDCIL
jgi:hypothetical protein